MRAWNLIAISVSICFACSPTPPSPNPLPTTTVPVTSPTYERAEGWPGALKVSFVLSEPPGFLARPWPMELDRKSDGTVDLSQFPARRHFVLSSTFDEVAPYINGFSVAPSILVPMEGELSDDQVAAAIASGAIQLLDVDPKSATRGKAFALRHRLYRGANYVPDGTIAVRPWDVLEPNHLYALVLKRAWGTLAPLGTTADFERLKHTAPLANADEESARAKHANTFDWLSAQGTKRGDIAGLVMFRTQPALDPMKTMVAALERLHVSFQPKLLRATWLTQLDRPHYRTLEGYYCTPNFQSDPDEGPFMQRGGLIQSDKEGVPKPFPIPPTSSYAAPECGERMRARFVLTVPKSQMPADGWPLATYAHGTTGDARSVLGTFASIAARAGVAVVSTDQPLHGSSDPQGLRPGSDKELKIRIGPIPIPLPMKGRGGELGFYNGLRPIVMRDNIRQAMADSALLARLMFATDFAKTSPGGVSAAGPRFNKSLGYVATGHSQGTQTAAPQGAFDPLAKAVFLSAAGGDFGSRAIERQDVAKIRGLLELALGIAPKELDEFHPLLNLVQTLLDPVDPQSFGSRFTNAERPRSVLLVSGVGDSMVVDRAGAALTRALRLQPIAPLSLKIDHLEEMGIHPAPEVHKNGVGGQSTMALLQLKPSYDYEPHYVLFREQTAKDVLHAYLEAFARGEGAPLLGPAKRARVPGR